MERRVLLKIHIIFRFLVSLVSYTQEKTSPKNNMILSRVIAYGNMSFINFETHKKYYKFND